MATAVVPPAVSAVPAASRPAATAAAVVRTASAGVSTFDLNGEAMLVPADVQPLFVPTKLGRFELSTRVIMPPLTRCRAIGTVPNTNGWQAIYYAQRAVKGALIISEGTVVAPEGHGYPHTPGIYTPEQVTAWRDTTKAVKDKGAVFFCQLWHVGRASHQEYQPDGSSPPLGPSALAISDSDPHWRVETSQGFVPFPVPKEMTLEDIKQVVERFRQGARNAMDAGFDGVEIHGANGYLLDQFMKSSSNKRTDAYGGPIENRARLMLEVVQAVVDEVGADRVGLRLSPVIKFLDVDDETPYATFSYVLEKVQPLGLAYVHLVEPRLIGNRDMEGTPQHSLEPFRKAYKGTFIAAGGYDKPKAVQAIAAGHADLVAFGRYFVATPDLLKRLLVGAPFNKYDRNTFYTHGPEGYIDCPTLEQLAKGTEPAEAAGSAQ